MIERLFEVSGLLVMPFWGLMVLAPRWRWTERVLRSWWVVALPALGYLVLVAPELPTILPLLARPTLSTIAPLLGSPLGATLGWLHFLAFDLFVGRSIFLDARDRGVPWFVTSPILLTVLLIGPVGLLAYLLVRRWWPG